MGAGVDGEPIAAAALSSLPGALIVIFDAEGRCLEILGERSHLEARFVDRNMIVGRPAEEFAGPHAGALRRTVASVLASGKSSSIRALLPFPSGHFLFDVTLWPLPGRPLVACLVRNMRQLDRLEQQGASMRSRFQPAFEQTAHFLCEIDAEGTIVYVSERSRELELEPEDLIGSNICGIARRTAGVHPDDVQTAEAAIAGFIETGSDLTPYRLRIRDRTGRWLELECTGAWYTAQGGARHGLIVCRDAEVPLISASEEHRQLALEHLASGSVDVVMELALDGTIMCSTPLPSTWAGCGKSLVGSDVLSFVHPADRDRAQRELLRSARQQDHEPTLLRWRGSTGGWRWLEVRGLCLEVESGEQRLIATGRDAPGEHPSDEESASDAGVESLQRDNLALIAGGVAHDFNNLLTISLGVADLAAEQLSADSPARRYLVEIVSASRQAADLARQLLAATGRVSGTFAPVAVNGVLASMESLLRTALPKGVRLEYALCEESLWVEGDATQLRQVMLNLITNAGEAVRGGDGAVKVMTRRAQRPYSPETPGVTDWAIIEVRDNGPGVDAETLRRIFEPRFTTKATGHGLGLAVVQNVVRRHSGRLHVASADGGGTAFRVEIPVLDEGALVAERLLSSRSPSASVSGATVLLVEDDQPVLRMSAAMLGAARFRVLEASDARTALELLAREADVACAVVDLVLPDADGLVLIDELRRNKPELRVVVCSGAVNRIPTDRLDLVVLEKPFRYGQLIEAVWRSLTEPASS